MNVPSFASFPDLEAGPSTVSSTSQRSRGRDDKGKDKDPQRKRRRRHDDHRAVPDEECGSSSAAAHPAVDSLNKIFYTDRKGDQLNVTFGGLHSRSVPRYYRISGTLGLPPRWGNGDEYGTATRYIYKGNLSKVAKRLAPFKETVQSSDADFVPLTVGPDERDSSNPPSRSPSPGLRLPPSDNSALEALLKASPSDVSAWRALIHKSVTSSPTPKAAAEIKLAVLRRALSHLPNCAPLLAERARTSAVLSTQDETEALWESALLLSRGEGSTELRKEWLGWVFRVKGIDEGVKSVARTMREWIGEPDAPVVDVFGLACAILMHAGYSERALSAYQALLEAYMRATSGPADEQWSAHLNQLEAWWDEEHPRLGQSDYAGGALEGGDRANETKAAEAKLAEDDPFTLWVSQEERLSKEILPPSAGHGDESDPYSTTLFHDISALLPLRKLLPKEFFLAACDFLGLLGLQTTSRVGVEVGTIKASAAWWDMWNGSKPELQARQTFIRNVFAQLRPYMKGDGLEEWNEINLAFEWCLGRKAAIKQAKELLSLYPSSLSLWSMYADIERLAGKTSGARKVYQTVLRSPEHDSDKTAMLWFKWAALEWEEGAVETAIAILCQGMLGGEGGGPVRILRARQAYESRLATDPTTWMFKSLALLIYLTSSKLSETIAALRLDPGASEELHCARAELLGDLVKTRGAAPVPPAALRDLLEESARLHPQNARILMAYAANESHEKIWGRAHRLFESLLDELRGSQSLQFWAAIALSAGSVHDRREWLDRAVRDERMRSSVFIWRMYVELELEQGQATKAKSLLYRAVSECPWSKGLHLIAFSSGMRDSFKAHELNSWIDVMLERGIRLRAEWAGMAEDDDDGEVPEDGRLDEVETAAEERRRLMPY